MIELAGRQITKPQAWRPTSQSSAAASWRTQRPELDAGKCVGCNICWKFCPEPAILPSREKGAVVEILYDACKGCGVCAVECPQDAITMHEEVLA